MAEAHGRQEESGRPEGGHVDVIVALTHFAPPMLHTRTRTIRLIRVGTLQSSGHWNDHVMHCLKLRLIQFSLFEAKTNFLGISLDVVLMA